MLWVLPHGCGEPAAGPSLSALSSWAQQEWACSAVSPQGARALLGTRAVFWRASSARARGGSITASSQVALQPRVLLPSQTGGTCAQSRWDPS